tara:strand:- start:116 stop:538 length:423 start_codon:yes stop_codon:yes gene_type:complete
MKYFIALITFLFVSPVYAEDITIEMLNKRDDGERMVYSEDIAQVNVGDTITWVATTKGHNVEFIVGPEGATLPKKSKMNVEVNMTFEVPGIYYYVCTPHKSMGMIGLVVVGGDTSNIEAVASAKAMGKSKKKLAELISTL